MQCTLQLLDEIPVSLNSLVFARELDQAQCTIGVLVYIVAANEFILTLHAYANISNNSILNLGESKTHVHNYNYYIMHTN